MLKFYTQMSTTTNDDGTLGNDQGHDAPVGAPGTPGVEGKLPDIRKVKLVKGDTLAILFFKLEPDGTTGKDEYTNPNRRIHADCQKAFDALIPHFALLMDYVPMPPPIENAKVPLEELLPTEEANRYGVTAITIGKDDENFMLTGSRTRAFDNMPIVGINTPKEPNGSSNYRYFREFEEAIKLVLAEAQAWLSGAKSAPIYVPIDEETEDDRQGNLFEGISKN